MRAARLVLWLSAAVFAGFGIAFLSRPALMAALVDLPLPTPTARAEIVAMYGGLELGIAAFLAWAAWRGGAWTRPGLLLGGLALAGLAAARLGAIVALGGVRPLMYWLGLAEAASAALSFWAAQHAGPGPAPERADLQAQSLGSLPWTSGESHESLQKVYEHVTGAAREAIGWYLGAKRFKKDMARRTRFTAIVLVALAALLPLLAQIRISQLRVGVDQAGEWWTHPAWASVLLALAAALVGLDRFFGFSTAWIRYIDAEMQLRQALDEFQMEWQGQRAALAGAALTPEQTVGLLAACRAFATQLNVVVRGETALWMQEFQASLRQVDESVQARAAELRAPALTVVVVNGERSPAGWRLAVGGVERGGVRHGRSAALADLWPGPHTVRVTGEIGGARVQAEAAVLLQPGEEKTVELTLA